MKKMKTNEEKDHGRQELYSKAIRAGKRTYFFDVKATRSGDKYITITESKRRFDEEQGKFVYEKHKLFLFQEDFEKFLDGFNNATGFINGETIEEELQPNLDTKVEFEDLDN